jgi:hypothetical protein
VADVPSGPSLDSIPHYANLKKKSHFLKPSVLGKFRFQRLRAGEFKAVTETIFRADMKFDVCFCSKNVIEGPWKQTTGESI